VFGNGINKIRESMTELTRGEVDDDAVRTCRKNVEWVAGNAAQIQSVIVIPISSSSSS